MTVTDGDRFAIAMTKLAQARNAVYEATKIIEHLFEADGNDPLMEAVCSDGDHSGISDCLDPVTGLYPGQKPNITEANEEPTVEDIIECVE
jgi:hypothetical protein